MSMTKENRDVVKRYRKEVLDLLKKVEDENVHNSTMFITGSKNTGALRRRSMDLSKALSELQSR